MPSWSRPLALLALALIIAGAAGSPAAAAPVYTTYLPMLIRPPEVQILIGSRADADFVVAEPASAFPLGTGRLYIDARFRIADGQRYRVDTLTPSGKLVAGSSLTAYLPLVYSRYYICKATFGCGGGEVALDAGAYTVRAYVDDLLVEEVVAVIR